MELKHTQRIPDTDLALKRIMDASPVGIIVLDSDTRVIHANLPAEQLFDKPPNGLIGLKYNDFVVCAHRHSDPSAGDRLNNDPCRRILHAIHESVAMAPAPSPMEGEGALERKSGLTTIWVKYKVDRIVLNGRNAAVFSIGDITERKQAENESIIAARQRKMFANIGDVIVIIDQGGINRFKSPNIEKWFGWKPEEVVGADTLNNVHPEDRAAARKFIESLMNEPNSTKTAECRYQCKNGDYKWIEFTGVNLLHDPDIQGILGNYHDITDRRQAEDKLLKQNRFIETILDNLPLGLAVNTFKEGKVTYINKAFEKAYGWPKEDLQDIQAYFDNVYPDPITRKEKQAQFQQDIESGDPDRMNWKNLKITTKDGSQRIVSASNIPLIEQDIMISTVQDETKRKLAEKEHRKLQALLTQAQRMESVGRLAGGVAHDYNNMLGVIMGYAEMAMDKVSANDTLYEDLTEILKAAKHSSEITHQLLAFARKQTISPKQLDLNKIVESMLNMLRRLIGEDIDLAWFPHRQLWQVKIDPSQIDQILANLCVNARDAISGVGSITIETDNASLDASYCDNHPGFFPGEFVLLAVSDDGCGMDSETLENAFEPFFTTKGVHEGTGLGLATVYGIVKQNNGFINVYSEPGTGTTFKIYLPRYVGKDPQADIEVKASPPISYNETVLLAEDEPAIMKMGEIMLKKMGYRVLTAGTPGQAIQLAADHVGHIDLLITDVVMPEMNGRALSENLHQHYPNLKTLFMSGYTANVIAHRGVLEEGMNFIQKPFSMNALGSKIRAVLDQH